MRVYLRLTITDTLSVLVDGSPAVNPLAKVTRTFWYRLPPEWISGGRLLPERRGYLLDLLYGPGWRQGNGDGSRYVILEIVEHVLTDDEARGRPWLSDRAAFYAWREGDVIEEIIPAQL
jgi:hypothetical protein